MKFYEFYNNLDRKYINYFLEMPHKTYEVKTKENGNLYFHEYKIKQFYKEKNLYILENKTNKNLLDLSFKDFLFTSEQDELAKHWRAYYTMNIVAPNEIKFEYDFLNEENIDIVINLLSKHDINKGQEFKKEVSNFLLKKIKDIKNNLLKDSFKLIQYLLLNNIEKKEYEITINCDSTSKDIEKWFTNIEKKKKLSPKITSYNDLDYCPFIFKNHLIIEDVSSDKIFYCDFKNKNNFTWYVSDERFFEDEENEYEVYYESNVYISKLIELTKNETNKILVIQDGEIIEVTKKAFDLNLIQRFIVKCLEDDNKIKRDLYNLSFEQLLHNYTTEKEIWNIEERAFFELLENLMYQDGELTYKDFNYIDPKEYVIKHEDKKYFTNETILSYLENLEMEISLEVQEKIEILTYIENTLEQKYPEAKEGLNKIKEALKLDVSPKVKLKR